ncbi:MAG: response regulator [Leptolyngbya sp. SIO1D8]|nr:response regulator [Leptolyngbya sp. SIO1D8]
MSQDAHHPDANNFSKYSLRDQFARWPLGRKMLAGYGVAFAITVAGIIIGFSVSQKILKNAHDVEAEAVEDVRDVSSLKGSLLRVVLYKEATLDDLNLLLKDTNSADSDIPDDTDIEELREEFDRFVNGYKAFQASWRDLVNSDEFESDSESDEDVTDEEAKVATAILADHGTAVEEYLAQVERLVTQINPVTLQPEQMQLLQEELSVLKESEFIKELSDLTTKATALADATEEEQAEALELHAAAVTTQVKIIVFSIMVSGVLVFLVVNILTYWVLTSLKKVTQTAQKSIREANFDLRVPVESDDEIGTLARTFNDYMQFVNQLLTQSNRLLRRTQRQATALAQAKEDADAANQAKSEFLAHMSHELRTPLSAILGFAQQLQTDTQLSVDQSETVSIINRSGEHLLKLINAILELSKIEAGQVQLREEAVNLDSLMNDWENLFRLQADTKGLELIFERSPDFPQWVKTDEGKLGQIIINLLGNAVKFTEKGQVCLSVQQPDPEAISLEFSHAEQCGLTFEVSDTGPGIAEDEIGSLFSAFSQTQSGLRSQEGSGLGLAISHRLVSLMGGEINVQSQLHQGSTFSVTVPVLPVQASPEIEAPQQVATEMPLSTDHPPYRVLVVDDIAVNRLMLIKIFSGSEFVVKEARNGKEAIERWQSWNPDVILMDMRMPIMDGYAATRLIRQQESLKHTVVIAITASAFEEERQAILQAGCDDFIGKPFRREELLERVVHHLETKRYQTSES